MLKQKKRDAASFAARMQAFWAARQNKLEQHNREMLRRMLPLYLLALIFWRAVLGGTPLQMRILDASLTVHAVLSAGLLLILQKQPLLAGAKLKTMLGAFGAEILVQAALLDTLGDPASPALLYPLALVLMLQVYTVPQRSAARMLGAGAAGFLVLSAACKPAALFRRDALAVAAAVMLAWVAYSINSYNLVAGYEEQKRLHYLCVHDPLTGVFNVSAFEQTYHTRFAGRRHLFAILDMDNFKEINDSEGHGQGDSVLMVFSAAVTEALRANFPESLVGRFGGDEFLVAAAGCDDMAEIAGRLEAMQDAVCARMEKSFSRPITFSMGVVLCQPDTRFREVFARADREMYRAKEGGSHRSRTKTHTGGMSASYSATGSGLAK